MAYTFKKSNVFSPYPAFWNCIILYIIPKLVVNILLCNVQLIMDIYLYKVKFLYRYPNSYTEVSIHETCHYALWS